MLAVGVVIGICMDSKFEANVQDVLVEKVERLVLLKVVEFYLLDLVNLQTQRQLLLLLKENNQ